MEPPFPLKTNASSFFPPAPERKAKPVGPPLDQMKLFIGIGLLVAIVGFFMWKNNKPAPVVAAPPVTADVDEMQRNISSLSREVSRLQKALAAKQSQEQKLATLEQSQLLLLTKIEELTQRKKSPATTPNAKQNASKEEDSLPPPPL